MNHKALSPLLCQGESAPFCQQYKYRSGEPMEPADRMREAA